MCEGMDMSAPTGTAIVWFRRDLRLHDHPALMRAAAAADRILPLYVLDSRLLAGRFASPTRAWFLLGTVAALRASLRAAGSDLVVRVGDPRDVVPAMASAVGAGGVWVSRDHGPYGRSRDQTIVETLRANGVAWHPQPGALIHEPEAIATTQGTPYTVYSPFRRVWASLERRDVLDAPLGLPPLSGVPAGRIPTLRALGLGHGPLADRDLLPEPGEAPARARLSRWLDDRLEGYASSRDRLDDEQGTSRLSADLHIGSLSPLEVLVRSEGPGDGRRTFGNELVWREFYAHVLFHRPDVARRSFHAAFDAIAWRDDPIGFDAWRDGRTGYPVVDAGMRQLLASGWMHNRARMVVASFLTKHLLIDWRAGEAWFMRALVDGDVASNNGGWQWSASTGADPQPYFRIFNPVLQGRRHDPDGAYVRRWVPELRSVPAARIHAPWEMTAAEQAAAGCRIGLDYPAPIVDHGSARARALAAYETARRTS